MAGRRQKSEVHADIGKNRLYITLKGTITKKETEQIYTDIRFSVADLKPGFNVITDTSDGRLGYLNGIPVFKKIAAYLLANDVGGVVRITNDKSLISKQLRKIGERLSEYKSIHVASVEEAEAVLLEMEQK